jgi:hypothetical protein
LNHGIPKADMLVGGSIGIVAKMNWVKVDSKFGY